MMEQLFLKILNMSITASWLILAVILLRMLLQKAPKWTRCILWAMVAVRLVCPISLQSDLSLIKDPEPVGQEIIQFQDTPEDTPVIHEPQPDVQPDDAPLSPASHEAVQDSPVNAAYVAALIWVAGMGCMALYALFSVLHVRRSVSEAAREKENIWICDQIPTPFILGIVHPQIYIPSSVAPADYPYVLFHEQAHLARRDHFWKPLGFILLSIYWFNPLMWVAYTLLCRDIELACDEKVIRKLGAEYKKAYSSALINCSAVHKGIAACPLAFGETSVKERVKNMLNYKKPTLWTIIAVIVLCVIIAACFLTDPKEPSQNDVLPEASTSQEASEPLKETDTETNSIETTAAEEETNPPEPVKLEFPKLAAGAPVPEGCIYKTADGKTLNPGDAMPAEVQEKDEFITPQFIYRGYMCHVNAMQSELTLGWMAWLNEENANRANVTEITEAMYEEINGLPLLSMKGTFRECGSLKKAPPIPNTVLDMSGTFVNCYSIQSVPNFPANVNNLAAAFVGCKSLRNAPDIPAGVTFMDKAFQHCENLEKTPDFSNCTEIWGLNNTFEGCIALKETCVIPEGVHKMQFAFKDCSSLSGTITINSTQFTNDVLPLEYENVFEGCNNLTLTGSCPKEVLEGMAKTGTNITVR